MTPKRIGILGGMGPEATVLLMQKLIAAVPADGDADHIPLIVDQNPQVPSRIAYLIEETGADPAPTLGDMARRLEAAGAEALAMPCNTAHHFAPAIQNAVNVPFLDMVAMSVARVKQTGCGSVGILGSPALRKTGLFDAALKTEGLRAVYPENEAALLAAIRQIKSDGPTPKTRAALQAASTDLLARGATVQLVACTEFSLIAEAVADHANAFDTLDILIKGITDFALGHST